MRVLAYLVLSNAQIPMDSITSLINMFRLLKSEELQGIKEFIKSQNVTVFYDCRGVSDYPVGWKSLSFSCRRKRQFEILSSEGYVAGPLRGTRLTRAEFRINSSFKFSSYVSQTPQMRLELIIENSIGYNVP